MVVLFGASLSEPRIHEIQEVALYVYIYIYIIIYIYIYLYVCGVIIFMTKELNFESRTWVMVVKHVYTLKVQRYLQKRAR